MLFIVLYLMGLGHLATQAKMCNWLLKLWLHKGRSLHFAWEMIFHWQFCLRSHTCFMIILSSGLHRYAIIYLVLVCTGYCVKLGDLASLMSPGLGPFLLH